MSVRHRAILIACLFSAAPRAVWSSETESPGSSSALQTKATRLYQDGRLNEALPLYERLAQLRPRDIVVIKNLMWILWKTGDAAGTARVATHAASLVPGDLEVWNLLGQASEAAGHWEDAIRAYRKQLALEPENDDVRLTLGRLYLNIKDDNAAIAILEKVAKRHPDSVEAAAALAQIYFYKGSYSASLDNWRKARAGRPGNVHFQFGEAKAMYFNGQPDAAIAQMKKILKLHPEHRPSSDFLTDDALAMGNLAAAREFLTGRLTEFHQEDETRIFQLKDVLQSRGEWDESISVLKRFLNVNSNNGQAMLGLGDALNRVHRSSEAATYFERILAKNPGSIRAFTGLADAQIQMSQPKKASMTIEKAQLIDPTNPTLLLRQAEYLHDAQNFDASRKILTEWVRAQSEPVLPVLLYHALTPYPRDPLLAYSIHMSTAAFENQMKAIHDAGYTPVTMKQVQAWYRRESPLPKRPILITFDDARGDSFRYADPILEKYGLRATMCVPTNDVDENFPVNASWDELKHYQSTQRWEIQAHGDIAHQYILIDPDGRKGIFLANKQWLPQENRFESLEEWRNRVDSDHKRCIRKITEHLGSAPVALAWPEGNYGQDSLLNSPEAAALNVEIARRRFSLAFQEGEFGLNLNTRDPIFLTRLQPTQHMTGDDLIRRLRNNSPILQAHRMLLQHALWENRTSEAKDWMKALREDGAESSLLLIEEARVRHASGEPEQAIALTRQALALEDSVENRLFLNELLHPRQQGWTAGAVFQKDNQHRESLEFDQSLDVAKTGPVIWSVLHHYGHYLESGVTSVMDNGGGASALWTLPHHHRLQLRASGHSYSESLKSDYSVQGRWDAKWASEWTTQVDAGRAPYDTARALHAGIKDRFGRATVQWQGPDTWRAGLSGAGHDLSDGNGQYQGWAEVGRRLAGLPLEGFLRSSFDRTEKISPNYYSPRNLQIHQAGIEVFQAWRANGKVRLRYLPGIGKEDGTKWEFLQEASVGLSLPIWRVTLEPSYTYYMTPTYHNYSYFLGLALPF